MQCSHDNHNNDHPSHGCSSFDHNHSHSPSNHDSRASHPKDCVSHHTDSALDGNMTPGVEISAARLSKSISHLSPLPPDLHTHSTPASPEIDLFRELSRKYSPTSSIFPANSTSSSTLPHPRLSFSFQSLLALLTALSLLRVFCTLFGLNLNLFEITLNSIVQLSLFSTLWFTCWYFLRYYSPILMFGRYMLQHNYEQLQTHQPANLPNHRNISSSPQSLHTSTNSSTLPPTLQLSSQAILDIDRKLTVFLFFILLFLLFTLLVGLVEDFHSFHEDQSENILHPYLDPALQKFIQNVESPTQRIHHPHRDFHRFLQSHTNHYIGSNKQDSLFIAINQDVVRKPNFIHHNNNNNNNQLPTSDNHDNHDNHHSHDRESERINPTTLNQSPTTVQLLTHSILPLPSLLTMISVLSHLVLLILTYPYASHMLSIEPIASYTQSVISSSNLTLPHWYFGFFHPKHYTPSHLTSSPPHKALLTQTSYFAIFYTAIQPTTLSTPSLTQRVILKINTSLQYSLRILRLHAPMDIFTTTLYSLCFYLALFVLCKDFSSFLTFLQSHLTTAVHSASYIYQFNQYQSAQAAAAAASSNLLSPDRLSLSQSTDLILATFPYVLHLLTNTTTLKQSQLTLIPNTLPFTISPSTLVSTLLPIFSTTIMLLKLFLALLAFYWVLYPCSITFSTLLRATSKTNAMDIGLLLHELSAMVETHFTPLLQTIHVAPHSHLLSTKTPLLTTTTNANVKVDPNTPQLATTVHSPVITSPTSNQPQGVAKIDHKHVLEFVYHNKLIFERIHSWRISHNIPVASLCLTVPHIPNNHTQRDTTVDNQESGIGAELTQQGSKVSTRAVNVPPWVNEIIRRCIHKSGHLFVHAMLKEEQSTNIIDDPLLDS